MSSYKEIEYDDSDLYKDVGPIMTNAEARTRLAADARHVIDKEQHGSTKADFEYTMKRVIDTVVGHFSNMTIVNIDTFNPKTNIALIVGRFLDLGYDVSLDASNKLMYIKVK